MRGRMERLLGRRFGPVRLALVVSGLGYLLLLRRPGELAGADWAVGIGVLAVAAFGGFRPSATALGQSALLALAELAAPLVAVEAKIGASAALFELAVRRWGRPTALASAALALAQLAGPVWPLSTELFPALYRAAVIVSVPVLLAAYIRSTERAAGMADERAREAERSRDLAEWGARMTERAAIARELHDMVAHHLASTVLRVGVARHVLPHTDPRLAEVLDDVHASANTALADLRRLLAALREPAADHLAPLLAETTDLPAAVHGVVERSRRLGTAVEADIDPAIARLDAMRSLTVLRLIQEGLANTAKHAGPAARVRLRVHAPDSTVHLVLENTLPAPPTPAPSGLSALSSGHGLLGMRERVALVGGTLTIGPGGDGWRIAATLPPANGPHP
ncbi:sensor histidine kinase [Streptomyces sp. SCL15-4]|uniref:sensor histidine kinase n=1 Tax=Streptomyces sp. SCL15-4 TaxID=2967221 RepID=UPI0029660A38|nr:histidine kinase [Streptomyces sp. SCL15-4]